MNSRILSSTVFLYLLAGPALFAAALTSGCSGSNAGPNGPPMTGGSGGGTGGRATGSGGATTGAGGSSTGAGGSSTGADGSPPAIIGWGTPVTGGPTGTGTQATVVVDPGTTFGTIGADFIGFSFEKTHLMNGSLTSNNTNLIALYKLLGFPMTRVGANDVERCTWAGTGPAPSTPSGQPFTLKITSGGVDQLCGFLAATGSKAIYGVNFQVGNVPLSSAEAAYVMGQCPSSIVGLEIGNEPDKFGTWNEQQSDYDTFADAILATPGALLVGPACTSRADVLYAAPFADSIAARYPGKLALLSQHAYVAAANSSGCSVANLQITTTLLTDIFDTIRAAATKNNLPAWRMDENNTCSAHGQMGVSDTFISGLWAIDYMFEVAKRGGSGINFHGSENGMDGTVPFYYERMKEDKGMVVQVQPEYYGLLLFAEAGTGSMVSATVTTTAQYFTGWAIKTSGFTSVVLNNRNASSGVSVTVNLGSAVSSASAIYLEATGGSLTAGAGSVTLADAQVSVTGDWPRSAPFIQTVSGDSVSVYVPAASAALVRVMQ
jgi:hypothetical protein